MQHEEIRASALSAGDTYRLMTDVVAPRPIAWVSTQAEDGRTNLAPFSYFQAISSRPATVVLGIGWHADGRPKDTLRNIMALHELTINHVSEPLAEAMNQTSGNYPPDHSEWDATGLAAAPSVLVRPPRVADAVAAFECRVRQLIPIGVHKAGKPACTMVVAEVVCFHVAQGLVRRRDDGRLLPIDPARLAAVGRMGGIAYTRTRDTFELERPKLPSKP